VVLPQFAGCEPLGRLAGPVGLQGRPGVNVEGEGPSGCRRLRLVEAGVAVDDRQRLADCHRSGVEVDVLPTQAAQFPPSHPGSGGEPPQAGETAAASREKERRQLVSGLRSLLRVGVPVTAGASRGSDGRST